MKKDMEGNLSINKASFTIERSEVCRYWLEFTAPIHKLTKTEIQVMTEILKLRDELRVKISDEKIVEDYIFGRDGRLKLMESLDMTNTRLNNLMFSLRSKKAIVDNGINKFFIPNLKDDSDKYIINLEFTLT